MQLGQAFSARQARNRLTELANEEG